MESRKKYTVGTRGSLLALAQTRLVCNQIKKISPEIDIDIKVIKTQGDIITDVPLHLIDGKEFFTKELDRCLINKEVDFVVHSNKDLATERPAEIKLASVTKRHFPQDVLLIKNSTLEKISNLKKFVIGTSSLRRKFFSEKYISDFLPCEKNIEISVKDLRGNVNTRIEKLNRDEYDAIILAFSGLERLAEEKSSKVELEKIIKDLNFLILPISVFTPAPAQGALAIECHQDLEESDLLLKSLRELDDQSTREECLYEKGVLKEFGGGCHLAIGAYKKNLYKDLSYQMKQGLDQNQFFYQTFIDKKTHKLPIKKTFFIGQPHDLKSKVLNDQIIVKKQFSEIDNIDNSHLFITSKYCYTNFLKTDKKNSTVWLSGPKSMKDFAQKGIWINGSCDNFGHNQLESFQKSHFIKLISSNKDWKVLTRKGNQTNAGQVVPCYEYSFNSISKEFIDEFNSCNIFYWSSPSQFKVYLDQFPDKLKNSEDIHCCGLGKTYKELKKYNLKLIPYLSFQEFLNEMDLK